MITGAEVSTIAKAGSTVTKEVRAALTQPPIKWPNTHEALMELYIILDDWCEAAAQSNEAARSALEARLADRKPPKILPGLQMGYGRSFSGSVIGPFNINAGYIERATRDAESVLSPRVPWTARLRRTQKRAAARRTLQNMLRIYSPDLLEAFEVAVNSRATWVVEHREKFTAMLEDPQTSLNDLDAIVSQMDQNLNDLLAVRDDLRSLIIKNFPLGAAHS